jgi:hypothetical protein
VTYGAYGTDLVTHRQASTAATLEEAKSVYDPGTCRVLRLPFLQSHNGRSLIIQDRLIGMNSHVEFIAHLSRLDHGTSMSKRISASLQLTDDGGETHPK